MANTWIKKRLESLATIQTGIAKGKKGIQDPVDLPYLRVANVQDGHLDLREIKKITIPKKLIERYLLKVGDVLLTEGGDFDKLGRGTIWRGQIEFCLHQNHIFVVRPDPFVLIPEFFSYQASSPYGKKYFLSCSKQTTNLASINSTQLKHFPVLFPSLPEQKKIVEILETWDEAIALTEKAIAAKQKLKKHFVSNFIEANLELFKSLESWTDLFLGDCLLKIVGGGTPSREIVGYWNGDIPWATVKDLTVSRPDNTEEFITQEGLINSSANLIAAETVIVATRMAVGRTVMFTKEVAINQDLKALFPDDRLNKEYLFHWLNQKQSELESMSNGSTVKGINLNDLRKIKIKLPDQNFQIIFVQFVNLLDQEINGLNQKLKLLRIQKQGLMQKLLTGKLRVSI